MRMLTLRTIALFSVLVSLLLCPALPAGAAGRDPFADGSMRASVLLGNGYAFNDSYFIVGVGYGYFVTNGLELGLDGEVWTGGSRGITKISPGLKYVVPTNSAVRPYIGVFYRRTMIDNYDDLDSTGGRAGVYFVSGRGSYFGGGAVYEKYTSCNEAVFVSCTDTYAEITFSLLF